MEQYSPGSGTGPIETGILQEVKQEVVDAHISVERSADKADNKEDQENQGESTPGVEGVRCTSRVS